MNHNADMHLILTLLAANLEVGGWTVEHSEDITSEHHLETFRIKDGAFTYELNLRETL
jgi:hypothetical protein